MVLNEKKKGLKVEGNHCLLYENSIQRLLGEIKGLE